MTDTPLARAVAARERAGRARARSEEYLARGDAFFAQVEENLARAQELIAANAELVAARHAVRPAATAVERLAACRRAEQRALEFAAINRDRGHMRRAHHQEMAAAWFAFVAEVAEDRAAREEITVLPEERSEDVARAA